MLENCPYGMECGTERQHVLHRVLCSSIQFSVSTRYAILKQPQRLGLPRSYIEGFPEMQGPKIPQIPWSQIQTLLRTPPKDGHPQSMDPRMDTLKAWKVDCLTVFRSTAEGPFAEDDGSLARYFG